MALDWLPVYPDWFPRRSTTASWTFVQNLDPIPTPDPPTELTWHPTYPDQTHRALRVQAPPSLFRWPMVPIADLRWLARYPVQLRRPRVPVALMPSFFSILGTQQAIAKQEAWKAVYPLSLTRSAQVAASQRMYPVQGTTILTAANCVEWTDETVTRPTFTAEAFQRSQILAAGFDSPQYVLLEDGTVLLLEDGTPMLLETQLGGPAESLVRPMMIEEDWC